MWTMQCEGHDHQYHPSFLTNLRPLMPRPLPDLKTLHFPTIRPSSHLSSPSAGVPLVSARWNPTPDQIQALEEMYRKGMRTPSADQIQQITAKLRRFGKIEGKNVFYWFQNHKARERQKKRRHEMELLAARAKMIRHELPPQSPAGSLNSRRNLESEHLKKLQHPTSPNCCPTTSLQEELMSCENKEEIWKVKYKSDENKKKKWRPLEIPPNNSIQKNENPHEKMKGRMDGCEENGNPEFEFRLLGCKNDDKSSTVLELFPVKENCSEGFSNVGTTTPTPTPTPTPFFEFLPTKI